MRIFMKQHPDRFGVDYHEMIDCDALSFIRTSELKMSLNYLRILSREKIKIAAEPLVNRWPRWACSIAPLAGR